MHEELAKEILQDLLKDFTDQGLSSAALRTSYKGPSLKALRQKYCGEGSAPAVDFDLAVQDLEEEQSIKTGPTVPFEPNSRIIGVYSKREYLFLD